MNEPINLRIEELFTYPKRTPDTRRWHQIENQIHPAGVAYKSLCDFDRKLANFLSTMTTDIESGHVELIFGKKVHRFFLLIAWEGNEIVGSLDGYEDKHGVHVSFIKSKVQRRGIGRYLLEQIALLAENKPVMLNSVMAAVPFYRHLGFVHKPSEQELNYQHLEWDRKFQDESARRARWRNLEVLSL